MKENNEIIKRLDRNITELKKNLIEIRKLHR